VIRMIDWEKWKKLVNRGCYHRINIGNKFENIRCGIGFKFDECCPENCYKVKIK
jgi:hypothetical protein